MVDFQRGIRKGWLGEGESVKMIKCQCAWFALLENTLSRGGGQNNPPFMHRREWEGGAG